MYGNSKVSEFIGGGRRGGTGDVKRDDGRDVNDTPFFLVVASKVCFPSFASEFSLSYGCAIFLSQSLYSAALLTDGGRLNGSYVKFPCHLGRTVVQHADSVSELCRSPPWGPYHSILEMPTRKVGAAFPLFSKL
jgi:hypothetical protein